jgi:thiamine-phosphate pyrophosphorylase
VRFVSTGGGRHACSGRGGDFALTAVRGLYYVTSDVPQMGRTHEGVAASAAAGGSRLVQFRGKSACATRNLEAARALRDLCRAFGLVFVVNDDPAIAIEVDADGLHLGQSDLHRLDEWWEFIDSRGDGERRPRLLGISAATVEEAVRAVGLGADHLGVGPIFATSSKADAVAPVGLAGLRAIREAVEVPIAAIGGIDARNAADVLATGAGAVCVMSAISTAEDPRGAARRLADICAAYGADAGACPDRPTGRRDTSGGVLR